MVTRADACVLANFWQIDPTWIFYEPLLPPGVQVLEVLVAFQSAARSITQSPKRSQKLLGHVRIDMNLQMLKLRVILRKDRAKVAFGFANLFHPEVKHSEVGFHDASGDRGRRGQVPVTVWREKRGKRIQPKEGERHQHDSAKTTLPDEPAGFFKLDLLDVVNNLFRTAPKEF
jgi:hypothetical protein